MARGSLRPIVVADGYCPRCGRVAPIPAYADIARCSGGYLVLDDTQALDILGEAPNHANPYGRGGGSLRWHATFGPHIVVGTPLAKGFGAPLAVLSGSARTSSQIDALMSAAAISRCGANKSNGRWSVSRSPRQGTLDQACAFLPAGAGTQ